MQFYTVNELLHVYIYRHVRYLTENDLVHGTCLQHIYTFNYIAMLYLCNIVMN